MVVTAPADADGRTLDPYHVEDDTDGWRPLPGVEAIEKGSALDASGLLDAPAGKHGFVDRQRRPPGLRRGGPGPVLRRRPAAARGLPRARGGRRPGRSPGPVGGQPRPARRPRLAARAGPEPLRRQPRRHQGARPEALARLDHLIAALKARGIYVALELPAAAAVPRGRRRPRRARPAARGGPGRGLRPAGPRPSRSKPPTRLLGHVNPETGLALRDDPALAWVTLAGELSLFDQIDDPTRSPPEFEATLKGAQGRAPARAVGAGRPSSRRSGRRWPTTSARRA